MLVCNIHDVRYKNIYSRSLDLYIFIIIVGELKETMDLVKTWVVLRRFKVKMERK